MLKKQLWVDFTFATWYAVLLEAAIRRWVRFGYKQTYNIQVGCGVQAYMFKQLVVQAISSLIATNVYQLQHYFRLIIAHLSCNNSLFELLLLFYHLSVPNKVISDCVL